MSITVIPGRLSGEITAPPSKSVMQRICAAVWAKGGEAVISNPGRSADDRVLLELLTAAGCAVHPDGEGKLHIRAIPAARHELDRVHFGESGLAARMCIPLLALAGRDMTLEAAGSLTGRPMQFFEQVLPSLGVNIELQQGHLPGTIAGRLVPRTIRVDGSVSSQFITGLLLAYAAAEARDVQIEVEGLVSAPYIDLTLDVMRAAGLRLPVRKGPGCFYFDSAAAPASGKVLHYTVEGDWSAGAFWLVAGAIAGPLTVRGLDLFTEQADKAVLGPLMDCGALMSIESGQIRVSPAPLKAFHANAAHSPDLFPPLAVLACYASGTSVIEGVSRLRHKESDRGEAIRRELGKMGAEISFQDDYMIIRGGNPLQQADTGSHGDHRIAMMCAIAALGAGGGVRIEGAGAVSKSYPGFFEDLQHLGGTLEAS